MSQQVIVPRRKFHLPVAEVLLFLGALLLAIGFVTFLAGCQTETKSQMHTDRSVGVDERGNPFYREQTTNGTRSVAPGPTSQPTFSEATRDGASSSASGRQTKPLEAYIDENRDKFFYGGGLIFIAAGLAVAWFVNKVFGAAIASAGILVCAMPMLLDGFEPFVPFLIVGAISMVCIGGAWFLALSYSRRKENQSAISSAIALASNGRSQEAIAALKEAPTARDVVRQRKADKLKVAANDPPAVVIATGN